MGSGRPPTPCGREHHAQIALVSAYGTAGGFLPPVATKLTQSPWFLKTAEVSPAAVLALVLRRRKWRGVTYDDVAAGHRVGREWRGHLRAVGRHDVSGVAKRVESRAGGAAVDGGYGEASEADRALGHPTSITARLPFTLKQLTRALEVEHRELIPGGGPLGHPPMHRSSLATDEVVKPTDGVPRPPPPCPASALVRLPRPASAKDAPSGTAAKESS